MLNIVGAFVVFGTDRAPEPHILSAGLYSIYIDRIRVAGPEKAAAATFGNGFEYALPCTKACMEHMALEYDGPHAMLLKTMCARIASGGPLGPTAGDGGKKVPVQPIVPKKPRSGGVAQKLPVQEASK